MKCIAEGTNGNNTVECGVVTKPKCQGGDAASVWMENSAGDCYYYGSTSKCLGKSENGSNTKIITGLTAWTDGQVLTIALDCDENKIGFWKDKTKLGVMDIKKGQTYYPAMAMYAAKERIFELVTEHSFSE